ncbi:MAG: SDR family oxidoreductase [Chloroflexota bacterium]
MANSTQFSLNGKVAIVTGGAGLLGEEHCHALAEAGANLVVVDLNIDKAKAVAAQMSELYEIDALALKVDVTSKPSILDGKKKILDWFGRIDILVNNAALNEQFENPAFTAEQSKFENFPLEIWNQSLQSNVTSVFLCSQVWGSVMADQGSGSIINIASTYGVVGPNQDIYKTESGAQPFYKSPAYPTTKGAVVNFTRFLAAYWGDRGVRVNTLTPGGVENQQADHFIENYARLTPLGRMSQKSEYRGAIVFLASDASSYMTGSNLIVDGGWTAW